jgi:hypothetical protein
MRLFSRYNLLILLVAAPLALQIVFWIRSYFGNDYIFCRWLKVTDENGNQADLMSRTPREWHEYPGSKFQTRYAAIASRGGGVCVGLVLGRYLTTGEFDRHVMLLLLREQMYRTNHDPRGRFIGFRHSASTEYPLIEEEPRFGFDYQNHLYSSPGSRDIYREHWAFVVPHWFVFLLLLLSTNRLLIRYIRKSRWQARGCCLKCGYDLRATPGKCPECGTQSTSNRQ